jgi:hypothetical protein
MSELSLWLDNSGSEPVRLTVDDNIPLYLLKSRLIAQSNSSRIGAERSLTSYQVVNLRTGKILENDLVPISILLKAGDHLILQNTFETKDEKAPQTTDSSSIKTPLKSEGISKAVPYFQTFGITGIKPYELNFTTDYPVLAINFRYKYVGNSPAIINSITKRRENIWPAQKRIYAKDTYFLITDQESKFRWLSSSESSFYIPDLIKSYPDYNERLSRYSIEDKNMGESKNMIYPVRPFSITGIGMEGFEPEKEYPVLAIDIDQYIPENVEQQEEEVPEEPESMAFFLVGDDNGEFAWIAEDECRLYPLKN